MVLGELLKCMVLLVLKVMFEVTQRHYMANEVPRPFVLKACGWASYYWVIITRFKRFNRRILDEFQEAQDDHKNHLKRPHTPLCLAGSVPKMYPKKVA